jgi:hypothetical protein
VLHDKKPKMTCACVCHVDGKGPECSSCASGNHFLAGYAVASEPAQATEPTCEADEGHDTLDSPAHPHWHGDHTTCDPFAAKLERQRRGIVDPIKFERGVTDPEGAKLLDGTEYDSASGKTTYRTGELAYADRIAELKAALRATNAEIIRYGTSPDTYDWADMTARTRANAEIVGD